MSDDMDGGRRGKMSPWIKHVMSFKKPGMTLGDAMKAAKPSWKSAKKGGQMMGKAGPMGGRRTRKHKGGQLYSFAGGPYTGSVLSDGAAPTQRLPDATWKGNPALMSGGRHRRGHRGGQQLAPASVGGTPAQTPYSGLPTSAPKPGGPAPAPRGGRRTRRAGRR
jgi:hypothetical protein